MQDKELIPLKRFLCSLLAASMFAVPALAESDAAALAQSLVPESAVLISQEKEDGFTSFEYWVDSSQEFVEILIDPATQQLQRVEYEQRNDNGSATVTLSKEDAQAKVQAMYPDASVDFVWLDTDDGLSSYKVAFTTPSFSGVAAVNPETGTVIQRDLLYASAQTAGAQTLASVQALALARVPGGTLVSLDQDTDDGRVIFEGEIASGNVRYEFEVDAATGRFLEWYAKSYNQPVPTASSSTGTASSASSAAQSGLIGTSKASEIAVNKAGGGQASVHEVDRDDGRTVYEGTVINGNNRYDFEIDAQTGAILDWELEGQGSASSGSSSSRGYDDDDDRYDRDDDDRYDRDDDRDDDHDDDDDRDDHDDDHDDDRDDDHDDD